VAAANPKTFFQVYWAGGRAEIAARVERARAAGAAGLIITLDWTFDTARDWGSPKIPERIDLATIVRYAPQAVVRPRWLAAYARTLRPPDLRVPNMVAAGRPAPTFFGPAPSGPPRRRRPGTTWPGWPSCGAGRSWSRASPGSTTPSGPSTPEPRLSRAGVENVLDILRGGIDSALLGLGKASIGDLAPDDIVVPPGFTRTLGGDGPVFDPAGSRQAAAG